MRKRNHVVPIRFSDHELSVIDANAKRANMSRTEYLLSAGTDKPIVIQKKAFLAMTTGINMEVFFQKKIGTALFGGEGFIMQKLSGQGTVLLEIDGSAINYSLKAGEKMLISTGHLAMMEQSVSMDIQSIKGVKNALFGGEDLFNTVVTGPGVVTVQTMPMSNFAAAVAKLIPMPSGNK